MLRKLFIKSQYITEVRIGTDFSSFKKFSSFVWESFWEKNSQMSCFRKPGPSHHSLLVERDFSSWYIRWIEVWKNISPIVIFVHFLKLTHSIIPKGFKGEVTTCLSMLRKEWSPTKVWPCQFYVLVLLLTFE